jgi:hypothetical protein
MAMLTETRTLHLVDLENLLGNDRFGDGDAGVALERYLELARWEPGDHVIVAAHPDLVERFAFAPPVPCNIHAVRGRDSADVMLLAQAPAELLAKRFTRLVIGSGDAIFLARAKAARDHGVGVAVISRPTACSGVFRKNGFPVLEFDDAALRSDLAPA